MFYEVEAGRRARLATSITGVVCILMAATESHAQQDPFIWLEDVESPRALEWVETRMFRPEKRGA